MHAVYKRNDLVKPLAAVASSVRTKKGKTISPISKQQKAQPRSSLPNEESDFNCAFNWQAQVPPIKVSRTPGPFPRAFARNVCT